MRSRCNSLGSRFNVSHVLEITSFWFSSGMFSILNRNPQLSVHHHCIICASSAHQDCIQTASSVHHQCIISASLAHHQRIISESSAHHQCIISASSAHHQCIISASSVHHQYIISASSVQHKRVPKRRIDYSSLKFLGIPKLGPTCQVHLV